MAAPTAAELLDLAALTFRPEGVAAWFFAPHALLDGARPVELLDAAAGRTKVERILAGLADGVVA